MVNMKSLNGYGFDASALGGKSPDDFSLSDHKHSFSEITNKPDAYPPETHGHKMSEVEGLSEAIASAGSMKTINGKTPDASGAVTLEMGDIDGLNDAIAGAGKVKTVAGVAPGEDGNVALDAGKIGYGDSNVGTELNQLKDDKLDKTATAADSAKLGGQLPAYYATASEVDAKANKTDVLTYEEIQASTDLSGKIASASALKTVIKNTNLHTYVWFGNANSYLKFKTSNFSRRPYFIFGDGNEIPFFGVFFVSGDRVNGFKITSIGTSEITGSVVDNVVTVNSATTAWSLTCMICETAVEPMY